jgi:NADH-quinone oxidoreductase subunit A
MEHLAAPALPVFLLVICVVGLGIGLLVAARIVRRGRIAPTPYESGVDPIHDTRRRFDVRFHLLAIAFLVFDVELLFLYPWAVSSGQAAMERGRETRGEGQATAGQEPVASESPSASTAKRTAPLSSMQRSEQCRVSDSVFANSHVMFTGAMIFVILLTLGYVYDWRKGVFRWR